MCIRDRHKPECTTYRRIPNPELFICAAGVRFGRAPGTDAARRSGLWRWSPPSAPPESSHPRAGTAESKVLMSRLGVPQLPGRPCLSAHDTFPSCKISYQCQFADLRVNLLAPHFTDHSLHHHHAQVTLIFGVLIFGTLIPGTLIPGTLISDALISGAAARGRPTGWMCGRTRDVYGPTISRKCEINLQSGRLLHISE